MEAQRHPSGVRYSQYLWKHRNKRNQLAERGIPAWKLIAEAQGKSVQELMKMSEQGKLFADDVLPTLIEGMQNKFGGAMDKQSQTFNGMISTLRDGLKMLAGDLTAGLFESIKGILPPIIKLVDNMRNAFKSGGFSGMLKSMFPPSALSAAQAIFNGIKAVLDWFKPVINDAIAFFNSIIGQLTTFWKQNGDQIIQAVQNMWTIIVTIFKALSPILLFVIQMVWGSIKNVIQGAVNVIMGIVKIFAGLFTGDWSKMWEGIKQLFSGAIELIWGLINLAFFGRILSGIKTFAVAAGSGIKALWTAIVNIFKSAGTGIVNFAKNIWNNVVSVFNFFRSTGLSIFNSFRATISTIWQVIKSNVVNAAKALWNGAKNAFQGILNTARNIFNSVKSAITNPIQTAKNAVLKIISSIKSAFSKMKITIPKPRLPKVSVSMKKGIMGIPYPDFNVSWKATGGIFTGASLVGVGEKGDEAIVPLSQKHRMKPFAQAVASMLNDDTKTSGETIINNYFNIQATIREEADIQKLSENLNKLQERTKRAGGVRTIGN